MAYYRRHIDSKLIEWKESARRKPLLIRGARQVRHVEVVPLYALSNLRHTPEDYRNMISKKTMELMKG